VPEYGGRPQGVLNRQFVDDADICIAVFWARLGSPSGVAASGTIEEMDRMRGQSKPVLPYFSERPLSPRLIDPDQLRRVQEFRRAQESDGIFSVFETVEQLKSMVLAHLTGIVRRLSADAPA